MLGITDYPAFAAAVLVFLMLPGPGTFAVLASAAQGGLRGGYASLAGIVAGDLMLILLALAGVAALMQAHPALFRTVQYVGVAYLVWVGLQLLLRRPGNFDGSLLLRIDHRRFFRQTFLITLINPKAIMFYMAFFPLFIDPQRFEGASTFALMLATVMALTLAYGSLLVLAGNGLARSLGRHPRLASLGSKLAGIGLVYFGWRLATD
ncbi:MAG: LysE family transporter [Pseudomonadota bacterium]|nr:LysE family transporter [Pseudomonadota bacterium]